MRPSTRQLQQISAPLDALERSLDDDNLSILRCLRRRALIHSLAVYLVGGPVRDVLMGRPIKDLDFVVEGDAPQVARELAEELGGEVLVHPRFGTATLVLGENRVDIVTARRETYPQPAALPVVTPGSISDDLGRRDFSINALALSLGESRPQVLDSHGGLDDIRNGLIRTLHPNSFVDDPTRILRAVRYEQRLDFRIEQETQAQLLGAATQGYLTSVTGDRLRHELERMLQEERPDLPFGRLGELGILAVIHPSLAGEPATARLSAVADRESGEEFIPGHDAGPTALIFLSALAYPLSTGEGEAIIHRLNMPNSWARVIRETIQIRGLEDKLDAAALSPSQQVRLLEGLRARGPTGGFPAYGLEVSSAKTQRLSQRVTLRCSSPERPRFVGYGGARGPFGRPGVERAAGCEIERPGIHGERRTASGSRDHYSTGESNRAWMKRMNKSPA